MRYIWGMKRPLYSAPDSFSLSPLLSLLPSFDSIKRLDGLTSSLFARYEKVLALQREIGDSPELAQQLKRCQSELQMLKTILDWLEVSPDSIEDKVSKEEA